MSATFCSEAIAARKSSLLAAPYRPPADIVRLGTSNSRQLITQSHQYGTPWRQPSHEHQLRRAKTDFVVLGTRQAAVMVR
jgi:hypothetical protein